MDDSGSTAVAKQLVNLQAVVAAQGELISRLFALIAETSDDPGEALARSRRIEEALSYAAAALPLEEASERLLAILTAKAEAKRSILELAEQMLAMPHG